MATPGDLGDFFKNKTKKKIKASNLNTAATAAKPEEKKPKKTDKDEEGWEEEQVTASTITRIEVVGNLKRDEDKKEEEETHAPAWGAVKNSGGQLDKVNEKRFPSLAKSVQSSNINIDDGSDSKVMIKTSKNAFAALDNNDDDDDEAAPKRPKEISAAKVHKAKGERETVALQREVDKYVDPKKEEKKEDKKEKKEKKEDKKGTKKFAEEEDEDDDAEEDDDEDAKSKKKKAGKKDVAKDEEEKKEDEPELEEDVTMAPDLEAVKSKYEGRRKLPKTDLPFSEMKDKENQPQQQSRNAPGKKKKFANWDEEDDKPKLQYIED